MPLSSSSEASSDTDRLYPRSLTSPAPNRSPGRPQLLTVAEDAAVLEIIGRLASQLGFDMETCSSGRAAVRTLERRPVDVMLLDLSLPETGGLALLGEMRSLAPGCEMVLIGCQESGSAVEAVRQGAREYLTTPIDPERLRRVLNHFCEEAGTRAHIFALETQIAEQSEYRGMVGRSAAMHGVFNTIERFAPHATHVLITGETGTGKELAAHAFYEAGPRRTQPFVMVNSSTLEPRLLENEFAEAEGGTLFLDEVGELSDEAQARLLYLLAGGAPPIGGPQRPDVAVVAVTSRDLRVDITQGRFNAELFAHLNQVELTLPPLRDRREDIPLLTASFVQACARQLHRSFDGLTTPAGQLLLKAPWKGNVRELRNLVERACMLAEGRVISDRELTGSGVSWSGADRQSAGMHAGIDTPLRGFSWCPGEPRTAQLEYLEREHIVDTLRLLSGNRMATAKALGISRRALYRRLERHHINHPAPTPRTRRAPLCEIA